MTRPFKSFVCADMPVTVTCAVASIDELVEERADLLRLAESADADGMPEMAKLHRHTASVVAMAIEARESVR